MLETPGLERAPVNSAAVFRWPRERVNDLYLSGYADNIAAEGAATTASLARGAPPRTY